MDLVQIAALAGDGALAQGAWPELLAAWAQVEDEPPGTAEVSAGKRAVAVAPVESAAGCRGGLPAVLAGAALIARIEGWIERVGRLRDDLERVPE